MLWFFSDQKNFSQDQMLNSQNNCWSTLSPQDVLILTKNQHQVHIKVFDVITSDGDIMPPFLFLHNIKLNMEAYIMPPEGSAALDQEAGFWKTLHLATGL